jgi:hypothetical protein
MKESGVVNQVLSLCRISDVYRALGGPNLRGKRGPAFWRGGKGLNVSLDDSRGVWNDFVGGEGGGILDLIQRVTGGSKSDALRWAADFAGVPMNDTPLSTEERSRWAEDRKAFERDLPNAAYWRGTAVALTEETLNELKAMFFDPTAEEKPASSELQYFTRLLATYERLEGRSLVDEYRRWVQHSPGLTELMVRRASDREKAERRALIRYLRESERTAA